MCRARRTPVERAAWLMRILPSPGLRRMAEITHKYLQLKGRNQGQMMNNER
jgi:hypothetical protein